MICKNCNKEFELQQRGSGGSNRIFCYECMPFNSDRRIRKKQRDKLLKQYSDRLKLKRGCDRCGYNRCAEALEWHHPGVSKEGDPANLLHYGLDRYLLEIDECILLCANCHREEHNKE